MRRYSLSTRSGVMPSRAARASTSSKAGAPHRRARRFDPQPRTVAARAQTALADVQMRQVESTQRVELSEREASAEILAGLAHAGGDRAAPLHQREDVDGAIGARGTAL